MNKGLWYILAILCVCVASAGISAAQVNGCQSLAGYDNHGALVSSGLPCTAASPGAARIPIADATGSAKFMWRGTGTGANNIAIGVGPLLANTTGAQNVAVGDGALASNTTNGQNVAVGYQALSSTSTSGSQNTAVGTQALAALTTNTQNTAIGFQSQQTSINGGWNTSVGFQSLQFLTGGHGNTAVGTGAAFEIDINDENTAIGYSALHDFTSTTQHSYNTAIGARALDNGVTGSTGIQNTAIGHGAGKLITSGGSNVILGFEADVPDPTASNQMSLGNAIYCTGVDGTGLTISAARCGVDVQAPAHTWDVVGDVGVDSGACTGGVVFHTSAVAIFSSSGVPSCTAPNGSMYLRSDGSTGSRLYISAGGGTWAPVAGV